MGVWERCGGPGGPDPELASLRAGCHAPTAPHWQSGAEAARSDTAAPKGCARGLKAAVSWQRERKSSGTSQPVFQNSK